MLIIIPLIIIIFLFRETQLFEWTNWILQLFSSYENLTGFNIKMSDV